MNFFFEKILLIFDFESTILALFVKLSFIDTIFIFFPLSMLILGEKSCFLWPTIFEIPQPN